MKSVTFHRRVPIFTELGKDLTHLAHTENTQSDIFLWDRRQILIAFCSLGALIWFPVSHGWNIDPMESSQVVEKSWRTLRIRWMQLKFNQNKKYWNPYSLSWIRWNGQKNHLTLYCPFKTEHWALSSEQTLDFLNCGRKIGSKRHIEHVMFVLTMFRSGWLYKWAIIFRGGWFMWAIIIMGGLFMWTIIFRDSCLCEPSFLVWFVYVNHHF